MSVDLGDLLAPYRAPGAAAGKFETVADAIAALGCQEGLRRLALDVRDGKLVRRFPEGDSEYFDFLNGWLRFVLRDEPVERMRWEYLSQMGKDGAPALCRDAYLADLWRRIEDPTSPEHDLIAHVERKWSPWTYYRRVVYQRFLGRFDLVRARRMISSSALFSQIEWPLLGITLVALFASEVSDVQHPLRIAIVWCVGACLLVGALAFLPKIGGAKWLAIPSLIPRLAAAVGIGFLFLASAPQLPKAISLINPSPWQSASGVVVLLGIAFLFLVLHISRRIQPPIPFVDLAPRAGRLLLLASIYTLAVGIVALPFLYSCEIQGTKMAPSLGARALCDAVALNLGVLLQLAWDEKPLTEPL